MNLDYVRMFYRAATLRSVTEAARELHISQPGAAHQIRRLEDELKTPLMEHARGGKPMRLTAAGERFVGQARQLLKLEHSIKKSLGLDSTPARLRVGANESVLHSWLIRWLAATHAEHSQLEIELTIETSPALIDLVDRGGLDFTFATSAASSPGVRSRRLPDMTMAFVGHRSTHRKRRYDLAEIAEHNIVSFQRSSVPYVSLLDTLRRQGLDEARVHAVSSISAMARLVASGFGIATLPVSAVPSFPSSDGLRVLPCTTTLDPVPIYASWRPDPLAGLVDGLVQSAIQFAGA